MIHGNNALQTSACVSGVLSIGFGAPIVAADSSLRYGRDRALVEQDLQAAIDRITQSHRALFDQTSPGLPNAGAFGRLVFGK